MASGKESVDVDTIESVRDCLQEMRDHTEYSRPVTSAEAEWKKWWAVVVSN